MLSRDFFKISESLVNCFILDMLKKTTLKYVNILILKVDMKYKNFFLKQPL